MISNCGRQVRLLFFGFCFILLMKRELARKSTF